MNVVNVLIAAIKEGSSAPLPATADGGDESSDETEDGTTPTVVENEVLFPEERILTLLEDNDGRMWQEAIRAETGYSAGKVSRLLTEMEEDGQITRYWKDGAKVVADPELLPDALTEH